MRTPEYLALLDMLADHPEFSAEEDNPCDSKIVALGKRLWDSWEASEDEKADGTDAITSIDDIECGRLSPVNKMRLEMLIEGYSYAEVHERCGGERRTARDLASKYGLTTKVAGKSNSRNEKYSFDKAKLMRDLRKNNSVRKTAKEYGISEEGMRAYLVRHNIKFKRKSLVELVSKETLLDVASRCKLQSELAEALGIGRNTVPTLLKAHGLVWRNIRCN